MRARSDSSVNYKNYQKSIEKALLEKFVNLSKDKLDSFINNTTIIETNIDKIVLKDDISSIKKIDNTKKPNILNHNILDKSYKEFIKQQYKKAKESFKMLLSNKSSKHKKMELKELSKKSSKKLRKTLKKENSFKNNPTTIRRSRSNRSSKTNRKN